MRQIPPIPLKDKYWRDIQKEIERIFNEVLFIPLYRAAGIPVSEQKQSLKELKNAPSTPLEKAIAEGKVWYDGEHFKGQWDARISKELREMGAEFLPKSKWWRYTETLPAGISFAVAAATIRYDAIKQAVIWTLDNANIQSIDNLGNLPDRFEKTIKWLDGDFNKALKAITIPPQLTQEEINGIAVDYAHSVSLPIKDWAHETVLELRQEVQNMVYAGQRPDAIARLIETKYGQSKRKAKFLASQETRLMKGTFDRERAKSVGSQKYVWRGRMDARERDSHVELEGEVIFIDSPPVVDHKTGRRAHAGEDYNCYHKDTEVMTDSGFKKFYDLSPDDKIMTLNPHTKDMEYSAITQFVKKQVDTVVRIKGRSFDLCVDKNHTFFVYKYIDTHKGKYLVEPRFVDGVGNLAKKMDRFYKSSEWVGEEAETIDIDGLKIPVDDFCIFMGYFLSEGSLDNRDNVNGIKIAQEKHRELFFNNLSFFNPRLGKDAIWIFNMTLKNYLKQFGYSYQKFIPDEIKRLPKDKIRLFLDSFCLGDGSPSYKKAAYGGRVLNSYNKYYTSSVRLRDDLIECVIKTGMAATATVMSKKGKVQNHRNGQYVQNHDMHYINELKNSYSLLSSCKIEELEYNDYVYDIEVEKNHTLLIKYNGCIHWNSNCRCVPIYIIE